MDQQEENWKIKLWKLVDSHQKEIATLREKLGKELVETEDRLTKDFSVGVKKAINDFNETMDSIVVEEIKST